MSCLRLGTRTLKPIRCIQTIRNIVSAPNNVFGQQAAHARATNLQPDDAGPATEQAKPPVSRGENPPNFSDHLWRQKLSRDRPAFLRPCLMRVDYIPDDITKEELHKLFSGYGDVMRLEIGNSRVEKFFGRAYILFVSSSEAAKAYSRLSTEELTLQGETLAVEMVGPTTALTESIYIGNLPTTETVVEDLTKMFSQYGLIEFLRWVPGTRFAIVVYETVQAAQKAIERSLVQPFCYREQRLVVTTANDSPHRVLHLGRFSGDEGYVRSLFGQHAAQIQWIRLEPSKAGHSLAWVAFRRITQAILAKDHLEMYKHTGLFVAYSRLYQSPSKMPPPLPTQLRDGPPPPRAKSNLPFKRNVLHVSGIPAHVTTNELKNIFEQNAPSGVASIAPTLFTDDLASSDASQDKKRYYRALISFNDPHDLSRVEAAHETEPLKASDVRLVIKNTLLDKLNEPSRKIVVYDMPYGDEIIWELWEKLGPYGKIEKITEDIDSVNTLFIEYSSTWEAIMAMEYLALNYLIIRGRKLRLNFASSSL